MSRTSTEFYLKMRNTELGSSKRQLMLGTTSLRLKALMMMKLRQFSSTYVSPDVCQVTIFSLSSRQFSRRSSVLSTTIVELSNTVLETHYIVNSTIKHYYYQDTETIYQIFAIHLIFQNQRTSQFDIRLKILVNWISSLLSILGHSEHPIPKLVKLTTIGYKRLVL